MKSKPTAPQLSIIIPAYNEEDRLPKTLEAILAWFKLTQLEVEVVIVDDGSVDQTQSVVKAYAQKDSRIRLISEHHVGMMHAILSGFRAARYDLVANMDADCATHPKEFERLLQYINDYDVVIGSRILRGNLPPIEGKSFFRRILSYGMSASFRLLFKVRVFDPQVGFKIFKRSVITRIIPTLALRHDGIKSAEILVKAHGMGYRIKEVPVLYRHDPNSRCVPGFPLFIILGAFVALYDLWVLSYLEYTKGLLKKRPVRFRALLLIFSRFSRTAKAGYP